MDSLAFTQIVQVSANYTVKGDDTTILVSTASGARTIATDASTHIEGRRLTIKDSSGNAGTNNITFDPAGSTLVDGAATKVINSNRGALEVVFAGGAWQSV
jgi:hypothetical protein